MKVTFWGVRGSYPVPGPDTVRYGGNTSCIEVRLDDGTLIILDAGSGLRPLGDALLDTEFGKGEGSATIVLTHTHWDHIMGFPFFAPAAIAGNSFDVFGIRRDGLSLERVIADQQSPEYCDREFSAFDASFRFHEIDPGAAFTVGGAKLSTTRLNHPYYALAYRVSADGATLAYVTDTSPFRDVLIEDSFIGNPKDAAPPPSGPKHDAVVRLNHDLLELMRGADLVIYDTFFEPEGYKSRPHWGHSTPGDALAGCSEAGAKRVALFHHAPENTDQHMDELEAKYRDEVADAGLDVLAAREGLEIALP